MAVEKDLKEISVAKYLGNFSDFDMFHIFLFNLLSFFAFAFLVCCLVSFPRGWGGNVGRSNIALTTEEQFQVGRSQNVIRLSFPEE